MQSDDDANFVLDRLACVRCGANLDGLMPEDECPNCSTVVASSIEPYRRRPGVFVRRCRECDYDLTGLPDTGVCPECGEPYTAATLIRFYAGKPPSGWLTLGGPPWVSAILTAFLLMMGGLCLLTVPLVWAGCIYWSYLVSREVAAWRYFARLKQWTQAAAEIPFEYEKRLARKLLVMQIGLIVGPWITCLVSRSLT